MRKVKLSRKTAADRAQETNQKPNKAPLKVIYSKKILDWVAQIYYPRDTGAEVYGKTLSQSGGGDRLVECLLGSYKTVPSPAFCKPGVVHSCNLNTIKVEAKDQTICYPVNSKPVLATRLKKKKKTKVMSFAYSKKYSYLGKSQTLNSVLPFKTLKQIMLIVNTWDIKEYISKFIKLI